MDSAIVNTELSKTKKAAATAPYRDDMMKLLAMITMLIDHIGYIFFPDYRIFRTIGRLAFPIFAYQLSVGYIKTSSLKKYASRLLVFGLISQIPYSFFSPDLKFAPFNLNIMFTLLTALGILRLYDMGIDKIKSFKSNNSYTDLFFGAAAFLGILAALVVPELLEVLSDSKFRLEYGIYGLLMMLLFHINRNKRASMVISYVFLSLFYSYFTGVKLLAPNSLDWTKKLKITWDYLFRFDDVWKRIVNYRGGLAKLEGFFFQSRSIFALIPIYTFGLLDVRIRLNKYIGYIFYPLHITILLLIAKFI
ncbi:hypothetical protein SDC9_128372 [bioreactor metagenome]|uniref:TraX protein n=1 Tax=bioreactor metagenome TaxID=1076179 RepID=A0A645CVY8_9ZZZZ